MAAIQYDGVSKSFGETEVIRALSLDVADGVIGPHRVVRLEC
jgi:ABC-type sugar transport system ATPase subunit